MNYLSSMEITFVESFSLCEKKELVLQALVCNARVPIRFSGIVCLNISNDILDMADDEISVVEVRHEYRKLQKIDLDRYSYEWDEEQTKNSFHLIKIHGNTVLEIICRDVDIGQ